MTEEKENKLLEILSNASLNSVKFKDALEFIKAETIKRTKSQIDQMEEKEKDHLLENLEKQIKASEEKARKEQAKAAARAKEVEKIED